MTKVQAVITTRHGIPDFRTMQFLGAACKRVGANIGVTACPHTVDVSRNRAVALCYRENASHLFFCDNDTLVPADAIEKLLALDAPVATGLTPTILGPPGAAVPCLNVAVDVDEHHQGSFLRYWFSGVKRVRICGASCLLIRRDVFDAIGFPWFTFTHYWNGKEYFARSEDLTFCDRVYEAGLYIVADGSVRCEHEKPVECSKLIEQDEAETFGSHQPVLRALAGLNPKTVLEFGGGNYSTPLFLDRSVFPTVERLETVETQLEWLPKTSDDRHKVVWLPLEDHTSHESQADLTLIDGAAEWDGPEFHYQTRGELFRRPRSGVVVLHDVEHPELAEAFALSDYRYKRIHKPSFGPHTGIASNSADLGGLAL